MANEQSFQVQPRQEGALKKSNELFIFIRIWYLPFQKKYQFEFELSMSMDFLDYIGIS